MELTGAFTIVQSQCVRFLHLDRISNVFLADIAADLRATYRFVEGPTTVADFISPPKGLVFTMGRFQDYNIQRFVIYSDGILAEGDGTTENMDELLDEIEAHLTEKYRVFFRDRVPVKRIYNSKIEITVGAKLAKKFADLSAVADSLTESVKSYGMDITPYEVSGVNFAAELVTDGVLKPPRFIFDRRVGRPFKSSIFYSEAPLPTKEHVSLIELLQSTL